MATVFSYHDSRAVFDRCLAARVGVKAMQNLIESAREKMRVSYDRADAHRQFVTMFSVAGMTRESAWHEKQSANESRMGEVWSAIYGELLA